MCWEISGDDSAGTLVKAMATGTMPDNAISGSQSGNSRPSIEILTPVGSRGLVEGSSVRINTSVSDTAGTITRVEFYVDGKSIGCDTIAPFDWVWFNIRPGRHELEAVGTDDNGATAGASIVIEVKGNRAEAE